MKNKLSKQEKEQLDNRVVLLSSVTILYAILLIFVQKMSENSLTVNGAQAFLHIIRWVSLSGAMICAAWSAYKEKRSFFVYCGICLSVFLSTTILLYCVAKGSVKAYYLNFLALALIFVMTQVFYVLKANRRFENSLVRNIYIAVCIILIAIVAAIAIYLRFPM